MVNFKYKMISMILCFFIILSSVCFISNGINASADEWFCENFETVNGLSETYFTGQNVSLTSDNVIGGEKSVYTSAQGQYSTIFAMNPNKAYLEAGKEYTVRIKVKYLSGGVKWGFMVTNLSGIEINYVEFFADTGNWCYGNTASYSGSIENGVVNAEFKFIPSQNAVFKLWICNTSTTAVLDDIEISSKPIFITKEFYLKDYLYSGEEYYDDAFKRALNDILNYGDETTLHLPEGTVKLKTGITLSKISNLTVKGNNTSFLVYETDSLFVIRECDNITLSDFDVDYAKVNFTMGVIQKVSGREFTVKINEGYEFSKDMYVGSFIEFDPLTNAPRNKGNAIYPWGDVESVSIVSQAERTLKIIFKADQTLASSPPVGTLAVISQTPFDVPGIDFEYSNNIVLKNQLWYMAPGMGIWGTDTDNVTIENMDFIRNKNTDRMFSACRDGMHLLNCSGNINITDCNLENLGDDGLNIHSNWFVVKGVVDDYTVIVELADGTTRYARRNSVGDVFQFRNLDMQITGRAVLQSVTTVGSALKLQFDTKLTEEMLKSYICNQSRTPKVLYENNTVSNSRGHGVLIQNDNETVVRNCSFTNNYYNGVKMAVETLESVPAANVIIENNYIGGYSYDEKLGDIILTSWTGGSIDAGIFKNITIRNNVIEKSESVGAAIIAEGVSGLVISNNKISNVGGPLRVGDGISKICGVWINNSDNVTLLGNEFKTKGEVEAFYNTGDNVTNLRYTDKEEYYFEMLDFENTSTLEETIFKTDGNAEMILGIEGKSAKITTKGEYSSVIALDSQKAMLKSGVTYYVNFDLFFTLDDANQSDKWGMWLGTGNSRKGGKEIGYTEFFAKNGSFCWASGSNPVSIKYSFKKYENKITVSFVFTPTQNAIFEIWNCGGKGTAFIDNIEIYNGDLINAGDINNDGICNSYDLVSLKKALLSHNIDLTFDVNKDSIINILDLIRMKKIFVTTSSLF